MALTYKVVAVASAVDSVNPDVELSHRTAALLAVLQPRRDSEQVVLELLDQLKSEKLAREARGLNHWSEHAPKFLGSIVRQARRERQRRYQEAESFHTARRREVLRFARAIVMDGAAAETVASDTYRELLEGSATIPGFFTALVCNARDYMQGEAYRRGKFVPLDEAFTPSFSIADDEGSGGETPSFEPMSHRLEDQDPLDILIAREDDATRQREIEKAKTIAMGCRKYRWVRAKNWARDLGLRATACGGVSPK